MELYDIVVQGISIVGMTMNILSYQRKTQRGILTMQLIGGALFAVHFIMLGAYVGGILNVGAVIRALVYSNREKFHAGSKLWILFLCSVFVGAYVLNFTVFGGAKTLGNFIVELLPVVGMFSTTFGMSIGRPRATRISCLICSPCWLVYNCFRFSIGGIICEVVSLCSIILGIYRFDIKKKKRENSINAFQNCIDT